MNPSTRQRILRQHLETDRLLGVESVPSGKGNTLGGKGGTPPAPGSPGGPAAPADVGSGSSRSAAGPARKPAAADSRVTAPSGASADPRSPSAAPPSASADAPIAVTSLSGSTPGVRPRALQPDRQTRIELLQAMDESEVRGCTKCDLCRGRTQTVFGEGDPEAAVMFIGEGPGQTEDEQGRPFVGRAGELLDKQITAMGFARGQVYIANVVKCRPPDNRAPLPVETQACWDFLRRQIGIIQPRAIVTLGAPATKTLLQTQTGITALRGTWHEVTGLLPDGGAIAVMPTFHPAYLLRNYTVDARKKVWSDLQKVMDLLRQGTAAAAEGAL